MLKLTYFLCAIDFGFVKISYCLLWIISWGNLFNIMSNQLFYTYLKLCTSSFPIIHSCILLLLLGSNFALIASLNSMNIYSLFLKIKTIAIAKLQLCSTNCALVFVCVFAWMCEYNLSGRDNFACACHTCVHYICLLSVFPYIGMCSCIYEMCTYKSDWLHNCIR